MKLNIAVLAGDGIGPEVTAEATNILRAVADLGGHDFTFTPALLGGVAITADRHSASRPKPSKSPSPQTPSSSAQSATTSSTTSPRTSAPKPASCRFASTSAASPTCARRSPTPPSPSNSPLRPEVTKDADILFVRELLGGLYFGAPRWWNKDTNEAINTMRYTRVRSRPRSQGRL